METEYAATLAGRRIKGKVRIVFQGEGRAYVKSEPGGSDPVMYHDALHLVSLHAQRNKDGEWEDGFPQYSAFSRPYPKEASRAARTALFAACVAAIESVYTPAVEVAASVAHLKHEIGRAEDDLMKARREVDRRQLLIDSLRAELLKYVNV